MRLLSFCFVALTTLAAQSASAALATINVSSTSIDSRKPNERTDLIESGPRFNFEERIVVKPYYDFMQQNRPYLDYYKISSYQVQGSLQDYMGMCCSAWTAADGGNQVTLTGTITLATSDRHRLVNSTPTFYLSANADHPSNDPDVSAHFGLGHDGGKLVPMTQDSSHSYFDRTLALALANGSDTVDFTITTHNLNPYLSAFSIRGPEYDFGIHQGETETFLYRVPLPVPEPSTWLMLLGGGLLLGALRRKRA